MKAELREELIALAAKIAALRTQLQHAERELDAVVDASAPRSLPRVTAAESAARHVDAADQDDRRVVGRIVELLDVHPQVAFDPGQVATAIGADNLNSVRSALVRLSNARKIKKLKRGIFASNAFNESNFFDWSKIPDDNQEGHGLGATTEERING